MCDLLSYIYYTYLTLFIQYKFEKSYFYDFNLITLLLQLMNIIQKRKKDINEKL